MSREQIRKLTALSSVRVEQLNLASRLWRRFCVGYPS
jgi:hypothetical protein